jgi:NRAMP (natural resistance-associated macrophage protein)-like metal ion transporter
VTVAAPPPSTSAEPGRTRADLTKATSGPGWRRYLTAMGPGLVTGASDDDPSGIATYAQTGAQTGLGFAWTALLTYPLMAAVQEICDRTALTTGKGLGELATVRFRACGRAVVAVLMLALILANALNIAADLLAVGAGMQLLHAGPTALWALLAGLCISALMVAGKFPLIAKVFKILCAALLSYLVVVALNHPPVGRLARAVLIPRLSWSSSDIGLLVAILGTTISPYLFFWQSAHRLEELRDEPEGGNRALRLTERSATAQRNKLRTSRVDVFTGMAFSNLVMLAIIVSASATLHAHGKTDVGSAAQAAEALRPIAGQYAEVLFALGFIGSGMLAVPVLAGAGAVGMAGLAGKSWGFSRSPRKAPIFYGLVLAGTLGGTALSLLHVNPIHLLVLSAGINGVAAAPFLILVMLISRDRAIMGEHRNGRLAATLGWLTTAIMTLASIAYFVTR